MVSGLHVAVSIGAHRPLWRFCAMCAKEERTWFEEGSCHRLTRLAARSHFNISSFYDMLK